MVFRFDLKIDLRKKPLMKLYCIPSRRCGCVCTKCGWRGYRRVGFPIHLPDTLPDTATLTGLVKGKQGTLNCPKCPQGNYGERVNTVVYTHALKR